MIEMMEKGKASRKDETREAKMASSQNIKQIL